MATLTSAQRKYLRLLGQTIDPMVIVGRQGVTDALVRSAHEALEARELIKIRFNDYKDDKLELAETIAFRTMSSVVGSIGHVVLLYRRQPNDAKRRITLPSK